MERLDNIGLRATLTIVAIYACVIANQVICHEPDQRLDLKNEDQPPKLYKSLVRFLFGDQLAFGQYCSSQLTAKEKLANDEQIESLYNGTFLGLLEGSEDWRGQVPAKLAQSIRLSMKSRQELAIICLLSSWRYASAQDEQLANAPHQDDGECASQLESLAQFVATLTNKPNGVGYETLTSPGSSSSCAVQGTCQSSSKIQALKPHAPTFQLHYYQQFHSFGRLPSGPPHKQNMLPGDYDNCALLASTRYCLGSYGNSPSDGGGGGGGGGGDHLYQIGMCLPRSCTSRFLRSSSRHMQLLNSIANANLIDAAIPVISRNNFYLQDIFCPPAEDSLYMKLTQHKLSIVLLSLVSAWVMLLLYGTFIRIILPTQCVRDKPRAKSIMDSFNLINNWRAFVDSRDLDPRLSGLSGVKSVGMVWLMLTHFSMSIWPYVKNLNELHLYYGKSLHGPLILQGQHIVSSFFLITGLLVGFKYLSQREQQVNFKQMILSRYFRLMPMYLVVWVYVRQFAHLLGTGPFWDSGVLPESEVRQCLIESWWVPLLMLANFTPPYAHCLITGWHIANDFQIYLLLPVILLAYRRSRLLGSLVAISLFVLSHLSHVLLWGISDNFDLGQVMRDPSRFGPRIILDRMAFDYVNPIGRVSTVVMGILVADLLLLRNARTELFSASSSNNSIKSVHLVLNQESARLNDTIEQQRDWRADQRRRSSTVSMSLSNQIIDVDVSHTNEGGQARVPRELSAANENNSSAPPLDEFARATANAISGECTTSGASTRPARAASTRHRLTKLKDICVLALGAGNFLLVMYSIALGLDKLPTFGVYTKAIAYPACRISIELSWSVLLYYLLRSNSTTPSASGNLSANNKANCTATAAAAAEDSHVGVGKPKAIGGENKLLMMAITTTTTSSMPGAVMDTTSKQEKSTIVADTNLIGRSLRLPCWNVLVKLNYALMLTHYALMRFVIQTQRELFHFTWINFFQMATFLILSCYLLALLVHLTIEMPLSSLVRRFVARAFPPSGKPARRK